MIRGRLAPSPTGLLHLGNAWAFLLAWLGARSRGGKVILRLEDIDPQRAKPHFAEQLMRDLRWLGLDWDEGPDVGGPGAPYQQSARTGYYAAALESLLARGLAYPCYCTRKELKDLAGAPQAGDETAPRYPGTCRNLSPEARAAREAEGRRAAIRLRFGPASLGECNIRGIRDLILGPVDLPPEDDDFALRRSDGVYAYQLAVVLDDIAMGVNQVARGRDILDSTGRQLFLYRLFAAAAPAYAHLPLILDHQGFRLAKRHNSLALASLRESGLGPEKVIGWLAAMGGMLKEFRPVSAGDLVREFSFAEVRRENIILPEDPVEAMKKSSTCL